MSSMRHMMSSNRTPGCSKQSSLLRLIHTCLRRLALLFLFCLFSLRAVETEVRRQIRQVEATCCAHLEACLQEVSHYQACLQEVSHYHWIKETPYEFIAYHTPRLGSYQPLLLAPASWCFTAKPQPPYMHRLYRTQQRTCTATHEHTCMQQRKQGLRQTLSRQRSNLTKLSVRHF